MNFFDINGWELGALIALAIVILGPERLPDYAAKLAHLVRRVRDMSQAAKTQIKEELGPDFDEVNWRQYDPRQYDPRRIVREALLDDTPATPAPTPAAGVTAAPAAEALDQPVGARGHDPDAVTPFDLEAT